MSICQREYVESISARSLGCSQLAARHHPALHHRQHINVQFVCPLRTRTRTRTRAGHAHAPRTRTHTRTHKPPGSAQYHPPRNNPRTGLVKPRQGPPPNPQPHWQAPDRTLDVPHHTVQTHHARGSSWVVGLLTRPPLGGAAKTPLYCSLRRPWERPGLTESSLSLSLTIFKFNRLLAIVVA